MAAAVAGDIAVRCGGSCPLFIDSTEGGAWGRGLSELVVEERAVEWAEDEEGTEVLESSLD